MSPENNPLKYEATKLNNDDRLEFRLGNSELSPLEQARELVEATDRKMRAEAEAARERAMNGESQLVLEVGSRAVLMRQAELQGVEHLHVLKQDESAQDAFGQAA